MPTVHVPQSSAQGQLNAMAAAANDREADRLPKAGEAGGDGDRNNRRAWREVRNEV